MTTQEELFAKHLPHLDEARVSQSVAANGQVVSFAHRAANPNGIIIQFAATGGAFSPMLLNQLTAQCLRRILEEQGF